MKIAVLGTGNIGSTLGKKWVEAGHTICFGTRDPGKGSVLELVASLGGETMAASIPEAIDFGDIVLFAIPAGVMSETVAANAALLDGKMIVDATNNFGGTSVNSMSTFAEHTPNARVYRAFNSYGWEIFENPIFDGVAADLFYCGPNGESQVMMEQLIIDVGLKPIHLGGVDQVDLVDAVLRLWFALAGGQKMGRNLAFKVLTR